MDTNNTQTWITGGLQKYRDNFFFTKNSPAETSSDCSAQFNDAPNQSKSRAALILTEVEEQLEEDETKYNSMKDTFDYIKKFYMGSNPPEINDFKTADDLPITETISPRETALDSLVEDEKGSDDNAAFEDTQYYDSYAENPPLDDRRRDEAEPNEQRAQFSARSYKVSPRQDIYLGAQDGNSSDSSPQNYFSEEASGEEKKNCGHEGPSEDAVVDDDNQIHREDAFSDISNSRQHPYQRHLAEYSKSIHEDSRNAGDLPLEPDQQIYSNNLLRSARTEDGKNPGLFLSLSGSVKSERLTKNKKSRSEKYRKGSVTSTNKKNYNKQVDDTFCGVTKIRRKKRKLKASNSRSTTATRDTFFPTENKKDFKKRKQRGHATMPASQSSQHRHEIASKTQQNWSEVVEIYHNRAVKSGSLSVVSSKHSRLETRGRSAVSSNTYEQQSEIKDHHLFAGSNDNSSNNLIENEQRALKSSINSPRIDDRENDSQSKIYYNALQNATDLRSGEPNRTKFIYKAERSTISNANHEELNGCHNHQHHHRCPGSPTRSFAYYDPMASRNYELPTVASKMKRVNRSYFNRSYFNRFNFKNIPFVVGTSVTPSYNLGLNIQETLSLIKTRQRMPGGVTPLLISKVSKGVRPVSTLLGCVDDQDDIPVEESGTHFDEQRPNCIPNAQPYFDTQQSFAKTADITSTKKRKTQSICSSMKLHSHKNAESNLQLTPSALLRQRQEELIGDSQSTNMNGIREVLVNFHDQFEAMNIKYEKLQEQAENSNDESLKKEIASLEKDLSAKEEEINAVVNLYKEVMALKQQMKLLHERNSLVCVATESPGSPIYPQISSRGETANPMMNLYRPNVSGYARGPSTSTKLAGLLRQIKIFQKQLK